MNHQPLFAPLNKGGSCSAAPLFKNHSCMVCEDTGLVSTDRTNKHGEYLDGPCWMQCQAATAVEWSADQEQWVQQPIAHHPVTDQGSTAALQGLAGQLPGPHPDLS